MNAAAEAYRNVIPSDRWREPYMPLDELETEIASPGKSGRVSIHLMDENGVDRGALQEVRLSVQDVH